MVEFRRLPDSALDQYRAYLTYAFNPTGDRFDPEEADELPPPATVGERRGLYEGEKLVSVCGHHFFDTRLRGDVFELGGLSVVATPPEFRRRGHTETLLGEAVAEYRDRDVFISALWAFSEPFYAKYGWATANRYAIQEGPPAALAAARSEEAGGFYQPDPEEWQTLNEVMVDHDSGYELTVDRSEEWWHKRIFQGWQSDPYVYAWEHEGSTDGYVVYSIEERTDETSQIRVRDMAFRSHLARMNLLRFLANHEDHIDSVRLVGPPDSLLVDLLEDPSKLDYRIKSGPMVRLTDVKTALEAVSYPTEVDTEFVLSVGDALAPWNDDTFGIDVSDGTATVERTTADPDLVTDIGPLSQLFVGYRSLEELHTVGAIEVLDEAVRPDVSTAFPERSVFLRETF